MTTLYVVMGETGEYSDHSFWFVAGSYDQAKATEWAAKLNAESGRLQLADESTMSVHERHMALVELRKLDPHATCDYTGVEYTLLDLPDDVPALRDVVLLPAPGTP